MWQRTTKDKNAEGRGIKPKWVGRTYIKKEKPEPTGLFPADSTYLDKYVSLDYWIEVSWKYLQGSVCSSVTGNRKEWHWILSEIRDTVPQMLQWRSPAWGARKGTLWWHLGPGKRIKRGWLGPDDKRSINLGESDSGPPLASPPLGPIPHLFFSP